MIEVLPMQLNYFDAFLNILGIIGTWPAIQRLCYSRSPTPLEVKLKWILVFLTAMMFVRIPYVGFNYKPAGPFVYLFAILAAYTVFLYLETLMRKHLPLWTKLYITMGSLYFTYLTVSSNLANKPYSLLGFAFFIASMAVMALFLAFFRKRNEHSKVENSLIDQLGVTIILLTPLLLTDIFYFDFIAIPRLGVCGILILTYFSLYNQALFSAQGEMFRKLVKSVAFSALLTFAFGLLTHGDQFDKWTLFFEGRAFALFFAVNLIFRIHFAVKHLDGDEDMASFLKTINESKKTDVTTFLKDINNFFGRMERILLAPDVLRDFDVQGMMRIMEPVHSSVLSVFDLKIMLDENDEKIMLSVSDVHAVEQMIHLLEKNEMTYISQIGKKVPHFILFNVPMAAYREMIDVKSKIVYDLSLLIEKQIETKNE